MNSFNSLYLFTFSTTLLCSSALQSAGGSEWSCWWLT